MTSTPVIELQAGPYTAGISTIGATVAYLRRDGRDIIHPYDAEHALPAGWQGKTLVPWPNRIKGAAYTYAGQMFLVPCNEPATGSALHGLVGWSHFDVTSINDDPVFWEDYVQQAEGCGCRQEAADDEQASDGCGCCTADDAPLERITLTLILAASPAYPWNLRVEVNFALDAERGLSVTTRTTNLGGSASPMHDAPGVPLIHDEAAPAPYGVSCHPYLTRGIALDECVLTVPATRVLDVDPDTMAPTTQRDILGTEWDWREGRSMNGISTDNAYTGLPDGTWQVTLSGGDSGYSAVMESDVPWVQIYSGEGMDRLAVAVEPMTCPPDAFNSSEDLITLDHGAHHDFTYRIFEE